MAGDPELTSSDEPVASQASRLVGRDRELRHLSAFTAKTAVGGGALLIVGEAGVGKSALLEVCAERAEAAGARVLRSAGAEFEADVGFAGLHQLLYPLTEELQRLSAQHRAALSIGMSLQEGPTPDQLTIAHAVRALLVEAAADAPALVVVDDLQWLDKATAIALGMVARRLSGVPVGLLAALRAGEGSFFESGGLDAFEVGRLDEEAAAALLAEHFPGLAPRDRQRVLADSEGNPLALMELPGSLGTVASGRPTPVGRRLQSLFARRISGLPSQARRPLLLAALEGSGDLHLLPATDRDTRGLEPAEKAQLVRIDAATLRLHFRHPLTRAAVVELSTDDERRHAHKALADQFPEDSEQRAWHLAQATIDPDDRIADLLEQAASKALRRGDPVGAMSLLLRAAELSPAAEDRTRRTLVAAYWGVDLTGDLADARQLIEQAMKEPGQSLAATVAAAAYMINGAGDMDSIQRLLVDAIKSSPDPSDASNESLVEALYLLQAACVFGSRPGLPDDSQAALERLVPEPPEFLVLLGSCFVEPARFALPMLGRLDAAIAGLNDATDPAHVVRIAIAATYVDRLAGCRSALWRVVEHGRAGGAITSAIEAFVLLGYEGLLTGDWDGVQQLVEEGLLLTDAHDYKLLGGFLRYDRALIAAARGDDETVRAVTDELIQWAAPSRIGYVLNHASHAKALAALGRGDFKAAYQYAVEVFPGRTLPSYAPHALWVIPDLVEAAVRAGRRSDVAEYVAAITSTGVAAISPRLDLVTAGATAMIASDDDCREAFDTALAIPDANRWPFHQARIQLAYGERLRRAKATTEARQHLTAALDTFERLGARPWVTRARSELRASGLNVGPAAIDSLTPQQREIARLAAAGLTNKQIGERLFLSPRTVGTHLYQLFPKLGVTSRAALRDALAQLPTEEPPSTN